jgi:dTDP-4-dehydrorhamnose 3,5-epimerase
MRFTEMRLKSAYIVEPEKMPDDRGFFARTWCQQEFKEHGLNSTFLQCNISFSARKGTLRGMHYQTAPFEEAKYVRCARGSIYDVIIDLRPDSETFKQWMAVELDEENGKMLYVPEGFAHGFLTRVDNTEVLYQMSAVFMPAYARGVRWNDPAFGISWPGEVMVISEKDTHYPDFVP